jgi:predicted phosphodiesterase
MCVDFLEDAISKTGDNTKCVVITHHIPSMSLIDDKYLNTKMRPYNQWFYNDMDDFIERNKDRIGCWIYGHTHTPRVDRIHNIPFLCNPIGYPNENPKVEFDKRFVLDD